jgi:cyclopropane fatty-acyl-phospholipid synthase-like methyltransferase
VELLTESKKQLKIPNALMVSNTFECLLDIGCGDVDLTQKISKVYNLKAIGVDLGERTNFGSKVNF